MSDPQIDEANLFNQLRGIADPGQRELLLEQECRGNEAVKTRLRKLIAEYEADPGYLSGSNPVGFVTPGRQLALAMIGTQIGPYELRSVLGEGGMGVVFLAEQRSPIRRNVALKLIKPGMDSQEILNRFDAERQALALMDHPFIARALDAGTTADGHPYFVMEYISGIPITEYCRNRRLGTDQRLELFRMACEAVTHAHQKGVIHRDLKPTNILITDQDGRATPKVIDFGVAKAISQPLTDQSIFTGAGQLLGTLEYMSPEQVRFDLREIDTRTDVYAMGLLLYELLTDLKPFDPDRLRSAAIDEVIRLIREVDPPRPSIRLGGSPGISTTAASQQSTPLRLRNRLSADLDWVVMKAIEKDRLRRYESMDAFSADIRRVLGSEPVSATPPTRWYRLTKFYQRNRLMTHALVAVVLSSTTGALFSSWQALKARRLAVAAKASEQQAIEAQGLADQRSLELRRLASKSAFQQGLREYDDGEHQLGLGSLLRARALLPENSPLRDSYQRIIIDRSLRGGQQMTPPLMHPERVLKLAFSPDGRFLLTACHGGSIHLWNALTGRPLGELHRHGGNPAGVEWSASSRYFASAAENGTVMLWKQEDQPTDGLEIRHENGARCLAFHPDEATLVTGGADGFLRFWSTATGQETGAPLAIGVEVRKVAFQPSGRNFVIGCLDGTVSLWNYETRQLIKSSQPHGRFVTSLDITPNGHLYATGSYDGQISIGEAESGNEILHGLEHGESVTSLAFNPNGQTMVETSLDLHARVWDIVNRRLLFPPLEHGGYVLSADFSADGTLLATGDIRGTAILWDAATGRQIGTPLHHLAAVQAMSFCPDGSMLATASLDKTVRLWNVDCCRATSRLTAGQRVFCGAMSLDGQTVAMAGETLPIFWNPHALLRSSEQFLKCPDVSVGIAIRPDGSQFAVGSIDRSVRIFNRENPRVAALTLPHPQPTYTVAYSEDGTLLATGCHDNGVRLFDAGTGKLLRDGMEHKHTVRDIVFSPDGKLLASASADRTVLVWDVATGKPLGDPLQHDDIVSCVTFSRDCRRLISGGSDNACHVWELKTGLQVGQPLRHPAPVRDVALSVDDTLLVTACEDGQVRCWDLETGARVGPAMRHGGRAIAAKLLQDDKQVFSAAFDGSASVWNVSRMTGAECAAISPETISLWTGMSSDADGNLSNLTVPEYAELWRQSPEEDSLTGFQRKTVASARQLRHWSEIHNAVQVVNPYSELIHLNSLVAAGDDSEDVILRTALALKRLDGLLMAPPSPIASQTLREARTWFDQHVRAIEAGDLESVRTAWNELDRTADERAHKQVWILMLADSSLLHGDLEIPRDRANLRMDQAVDILKGVEPPAAMRLLAFRAFAANDLAEAEDRLRHIPQKALLIGDRFAHAWLLVRRNLPGDLQAAQAVYRNVRRRVRNISTLSDNDRRRLLRKVSGSLVSRLEGEQSLVQTSSSMLDSEDIPDGQLSQLLFAGGLSLPDEHSEDEWYRATLIALRSGRIDSYRESCRRLYERVNLGDSSQNGYFRLVNAAILSGENGLSTSELKDASRIAQGYAFKNHRETIAAMKVGTLYRVGEFQSVLEALNDVREEGTESIQLLCFQAMSHARLDQQVQADAILDELERRTKTSAGQLAMERFILLQEARKVVRDRKPSATGSTESSSGK